MTVWHRIAREPVLVLAFIKAIVVCAVGFGLDWTGEQVAAALLVVETGLALVTRALVTPAGEVVAQQRPDAPGPVAGPAADVAPGAPVDVTPATFHGEDS